MCTLYCKVIFLVFIDTTHITKDCTVPWVSFTSTHHMHHSVQFCRGGLRSQLTALVIVCSRLFYHTTDLRGGTRGESCVCEPHNHILELSVTEANTALLAQVPWLEHEWFEMLLMTEHSGMTWAMSVWTGIACQLRGCSILKRSFFKMVFCMWILILMCKWFWEEFENLLFLQSYLKFLAVGLQIRTTNCPMECYLVL